MSVMSNLIVEIQEDIAIGVMSFKAIAEKHQVPLDWVNEAWDMLCEQEYQERLRQCREDWG
jgi:hypothetical protein